MNLLSDIREELNDQTVEAKSNFPEKQAASYISPEMPVSEKIESNERLDSYKRSRRSLKPFYVTFFVLLLALGSIYWFLLRDTQNDIGSIVENIPIGDSTFTATGQDEHNQSTEQAIENASDDFQNVATVNSKDVSKSPDGLRGMKVIASAMSMFTNSLPPDITIGTLVLDENTFTVDVTSSRDVESFYSMLNSKCPPGVTITPLQKAGENERNLISGILNLTAEDFYQANTYSSGDIENEIQFLATDIGVQVINLNLGQPRSFDNFKGTEIFIKIDGSFLQCQAFFEGIAQKRWNLRVSKILFIPTTGHDANLVLRFQKVESLTS